jgi:hypothetical protein
MKRSTVLFVMLVIFSVVLGTRVVGQATSTITVQGSQLSNGVVIMDIVSDGKAYRLTCNQAISGCTSLKNGKYQMVQLRKNFGIYECQDVDVYTQQAVNPADNQKLGEYCLEQK